LHTLGRLVPALMLAGNRVSGVRVPGGAGRLSLLALTVGAAVVTGIVVLSLSGSYWGSAGFDAHP